MKKLLIANFKQNKTKAEIEQYFLKNDFGQNPNCLVAIAPGFLHIDLAKSICVGADIVGQTVSPYPRGSYTGAVGGFQLKDLGVNYCIVGHSERRKYFFESSYMINNQIKELESVGITPIICFSSLDEVRQVEVSKKPYYLAFEPVNFINSSGANSSKADDNEHIEEIFSKVRELMGECLLLYGGSVNEENIERLCQVSGINGFLVGSASLNATQFLSIVEKVR